jgi:signal transduction histidine kinase
MVRTLGQQRVTADRIGKSPSWRTRARQFKRDLGLGDLGNIHSVRFRLSATIAILLMCVLTVVGMIVSSRVDSSLRQETDDRLFASAQDVQAKVDPVFDNWQSGDNISSRMNPPDVSELVLAGVWIQYYNQDGSLADWTEGVPQTENGDGDGNGQPTSPRVIFPKDIRDRIQVLENIENSTPEYQTIQGEDRSARVLIYPLTGIPRNSDTVQTVGALVVGLPLESRTQTIALVNETLLWAGAVAIVLSIIAGWLTAGRLLAPVKRMTDAANAIATRPTSPESLAIRIEVPESTDEVSHLAATFNSMLSRIEDAFVVQRRFVADASHELRTPLTSIRGNVDVLRRQAHSGRAIPTDVLEESLDDVHRESARMARLVEDLLTLARSDAESGQSGTYAALRLDDVIDDAHATLARIADGKNLTIGVTDQVDIVGDRDRLLQVAIILGDNAIRHTPDGGTIEFVVSRHVEPTDGRAYGVIEVRDNGEGIEPDHLPHLFERFYRAHQSRERTRGGTGLGLPIALGIVRAHGGWIDVESAPGKGSTFSVYLPVSGPDVRT